MIMMRTTSHACALAPNRSARIPQAAAVRTAPSAPTRESRTISSRATRKNSPWPREEIFDAASGRPNDPIDADATEVDSGCDSDSYAEETKKCKKGIPNISSTEWMSFVAAVGDERSALEDERGKAVTSLREVILEAARSESAAIQGLFDRLKAKMGGGGAPPPL